MIASVVDVDLSSDLGFCYHMPILRDHFKLYNFFVHSKSTKVLNKIKLDFF